MSSRSKMAKKRASARLNSLSRRSSNTSSQSRQTLVRLDCLTKSLDKESSDDESSEGDTPAEHQEENQGGFRYEESDNGFGNEEEVYIATEQQSWRINHYTGVHRYRGMLEQLCLRFYQISTN